MIPPLSFRPSSICVAPQVFKLGFRSCKKQIQSTQPVIRDCVHSPSYFRYMKSNFDIIKTMLVCSMSRLRLTSLSKPQWPHCSIFIFLVLRCFLLDYMMPKIEIVNEVSERSEHFFEKSKLFCERSEQALRRSYQNLARSANFLLVRN